MARKKSRSSEGCELNMTPMIDVVFQLIIFFVVTLKMTKDVNPDIRLEDGRHGETITAKNQPPQTIEIEVDRKGRLSIHNARMTRDQLEAIIINRCRRLGTFPVLIRADYRARHEHVKAVMDICTANGVARVGFVAIKEPKAQNNSR